MRVHAEGSLPGTDMRRALHAIAGEAAPSFFLPILPARGYPATSVGRMTALLPDMVWSYGVRTFMCGAHESRLHRAARSLLEQDMDTLGEVIETTGITGGALTVFLAGPVTCLSQVELPNGHWMMTDPGAVRDLMEQYVEMVAQLTHDVARRTGCESWLVVDESTAGAALTGTLAGVHRWEHIPAPDPQTLPAQWAAIGEAAPGRVVVRLPADSTQWAHHCAPVSAQLRIAVPLPLTPTTSQRDTLGELYDQWGSSLELATPVAVPRRQWRAQAHRIATVLRDIAVPPRAEALPCLHDTALHYAGARTGTSRPTSATDAPRSSSSVGSTSPTQSAHSADSAATHQTAYSSGEVTQRLGALVDMPQLLLDEWQ